MAFDPTGGKHWMVDIGDDSFDEINRVDPGMNGGWVQVMGPLSRIAQFKSIETNEFGQNLQQIRYAPSRIADTAQGALDGMFQLPGAAYSDPEFSWKYEVGPAGTQQSVSLQNMIQKPTVSKYLFRHYGGIIVANPLAVEIVIRPKEAVWRAAGKRFSMTAMKRTRQ